MQTTSELAINTIYLMGGCFVLGSSFTLLLLLLLNFIRRDDYSSRDRDRD